MFKGIKKIADGKGMGLVVGASRLLFLIDQPVLDDGGRGGGRGALVALNLDDGVLVLLQAAGQVGFLGRLGGLGGGEGMYLTLGI